MNKLLLVGLLTLSLALADLCHPSCNCDPGSVVCQSCKKPDVSIMDNLQRQCVCKQNYYTSSLDPFDCAYSMAGDATNEPNGEPFDQCLIDIGTKTGDILIGTDCHMEIDKNEAHFVISNFDLEFTEKSEMPTKCKEYYYTIPFYLPFGKDPENDPFIPLEASHWEILTNAYGGIRMHWTLIESYTYANQVSNIGNEQFMHVIKLLLKIYAKNRLYRYHHYDLIIYTYREKVQAFKIDVDIQRTEDCTGECVVIADLDVDGYICSDENCTSQHGVNGNGRPEYVVGDFFYAKIWFKDASYKKRLSFEKLFYLNEQLLVFDHTALASATWTNYHLIVKLRLIEPGKNNKIQIHMLIQPDFRLRALEEGETTSVTAPQFHFDINKPTDNAQATNSAFSLLFGLFNLFALILLI